MENKDKKLDVSLKKRPRSATLLTLKWLADKVRKTDNIKKKLSSGEYQVNSNQIAKAIINDE